MLERVIQGLRKFEEYAVRLPDEAIHRAISKPVEWVERKGISRKRQAIALSLSSYAYAGYVGKFVPGLKYAYQQSSEATSLFFRALDEGFKQVISE